MRGLLNAPAPTTRPLSAAGSSDIWSKKRDDISFDQLQKFWSELPLQARQELLRVDKQALFEQARKNFYCSRCNGLLLEGFSQIVMYGKSSQQEGSGFHLPSRTRVASNTHSDSESEDLQDSLVHPWGGLAATRDGILTLLDCFIRARSLKALQSVFDSARARERERELLYPDACGGGGRGWISQGINSYGRTHGSRETCALHTARLSCDTLVEFWSALGEETRTSLLRMKEEDFIERLMYRFDSKRFCRDCRRNVIREFKELKELKRMRRELRCTSWFCVADTAFQYEVSEDTVEADWHQSFTDTAGTYHHFEWAIGTGEGKSDILEFEDVGMNRKVHVNGLDLRGLSACFITLKAWKHDGRCTELCVKAHALDGQPCVHRRLIIGDGFVSITKGESISQFFEHAEEAEEEEDDDALDKEGDEIDDDGSRPQKHAKSPELAREFLLDAATVIFKEQVEKAFREGTARQNAHSMFVSLALELLEDRVYVACKEIITLEKQMKLLEEEEKEKREEEERRERRRIKEREKKLRRKERLKGKEKERERKQTELTPIHNELPTPANRSPTSTQDEASPITVDSGNSVSDPGDVSPPDRPISLDSKDEQSSNGCSDTKNLKNDGIWHHCNDDEEFQISDTNGSFILEQSKSSRRKSRSNWYQGSVSHDKSETSFGHRLLRERTVKPNTRSCNLKYSEKYQWSSSRLQDRHEFQSCSCSENRDYRMKDGHMSTTIRPVREIKTANKTEATVEMPRPLYRGGKYSHGCFVTDNCVPPKGKLLPSREIQHTKQVWEPLDPERKCIRTSSTSEVNSGSAAVTNQSEISVNPSKADVFSSYESCGDHRDTSSGGFVAVTKSDCYLKDGAVSHFSMINSCGDPVMSSSSSDNCSSCLSEVDSSTSSSSAQNTESSSTSDSEDASPQSEGRDHTTSDQCRTNGGSAFMKAMAGCVESDFERVELRKSPPISDDVSCRSDTPFPMHNHSTHMPVFSSPAPGYHSQGAISWQAYDLNGLMSFSQPNHYGFPANHFGFNLPAPPCSEFGLHYNSLQAITTPLFSAQNHSMYRTNMRAAEPERKFPERKVPSKPTSNGKNGNAGISHVDSSSFSLFHFGGPMAGAAGSNVNSVSTREGSTRKLAPKPTSATQIDITSVKDDLTVEEYSLFAKGNGVGFSFF